MKDTAGEGPPRVVAITAIQSGHQMADRWLTGRRNTIVAGIAGYTRTRNCRTGMIDKRVGKISRVMAYSTIGGGHNVWGVDLGILTDRRNTMA